MSNELKQSVHDFAISFGKALEDAVKETIKHSQELKEKEKAVEIQKNQVKIVSQIENLEEDMIKLWLSYLKEEKGITVGYGKNGEGRPVIKKRLVNSVYFCQAALMELVWRQTSIIFANMIGMGLRIIWEEKQLKFGRSCSIRKGSIGRC